MTHSNAASELVFLATSDLSSRVKGRAIRKKDFSSTSSVGWVPGNIAIGPLGHIVENNFGSKGDLRLCPDHDAHYKVPAVDNKPELDLYLSDIVHTDGSPSASCSRTLLRDALAELRDEAGLDLHASFEHEFMDVTSGEAVTPSAFKLQTMLQLEPLGSDLVKILAEAGLEPESWLPEYGSNQFEITLRPQPGLKAADEAILMREIAHHHFTTQGKQISFSPIIDPQSSGNGVHIHLSLRDQDGKAVMYDADQPGQLSTIGRKFASGILHFVPEFAALVAPLTTSYIRFQPDRWAASMPVIGSRDREAIVRICPTVEMFDKDPAEQLHLEFRAADIGANPWIALAMLVKAGLEGIRGNVPEFKVQDESPSAAPATEGRMIPSSLTDALNALEESSAMQDWLGEELHDAFIRVKRDEVNLLSQMSETDRLEVYKNAY